MRGAVKGTPLPLKDEQEFMDTQGRVQLVKGSIRKDRHLMVVPEEEREYDPDYCWTLRGNWFRRRDGAEVTGLKGHPPVTFEELRLLRLKEEQ